jgi:hypothetical protein
MAERREIKRTPGQDFIGWPDDEYSADLGHGRERVDAGDTTAVTRPLGHHEAPAVRSRLGKAVDSITVLAPRTRLQQGSTYLDLEDLDRGPFVALAGQVVGEGQLIAAKSDLDHESWNVLTGDAHSPPDQR